MTITRTFLLILSFAILSPFGILGCSDKSDKSTDTNGDDDDDNDDNNDDDNNNDDNNDDDNNNDDNNNDDDNNDDNNNDDNNNDDNNNDDDTGGDSDTDSDGDGDSDGDTDADSDSDTDTGDPLDINIPTDFDPLTSCPEWDKYGSGPPDDSSCDGPSDPNNLPPHPMESWFTKEVFDNMFPKANLGWGPSKCWPFSYEAFVIAARYFPRFATEHFTQDPLGNAHDPAYTKEESVLRDLAAFLSHAVQETGENQGWIYDVEPDQEIADKCFYRGGFYNWFEGGPISPFFDNPEQGYTPEGGVTCNDLGIYCSQSHEFFYPCNHETQNGNPLGCYMGRGAIQISYNYNYGLFNRWLVEQGITHNGQPIDILDEPNLVLTKMDPPLTVMASLWFYMTPQPPKPAMHDIITGNWVAKDEDMAIGLWGPALGPTSLVINNECGGEDADVPGGGGENRRIKAFKFFCDYFGVPAGDANTLTCNGSANFPKDGYNMSSDFNWETSVDHDCKCMPVTYPGTIPYFDEILFPHLQHLNDGNIAWCEQALADGWNADALNNDCSQ